MGFRFFLIILFILVNYLFTQGFSSEIEKNAFVFFEGTQGKETKAFIIYNNHYFVCEMVEHHENCSGCAKK